MNGSDQRLFGMALSRMNLPQADISDYFSFPHFSAVELPVESWQQEDPLLNMILSKFRSVTCGNFMEPSLCQTILTVSERQRKSFTEEARHALLALAGKDVRSVVLDCGMEDVLANEESEEALRQIVLQLAPVLLKNNMNLVLPFRAPSVHAPAVMNRFLRRTLLSCVKVIVNVHPCEKLPPVPETSGGMLYFDLHSVVFTYDADSGNRIQKNHVLPWLEWAEHFGKHVPFLLCPMSHHQRMSYPEAGNWDVLAGEFMNV